MAEANRQPPVLPVTDWDAVLDALRSELGRRPALREQAIEAGYNQGVLRMVGNDYAGARQLFGEAAQVATGTQGASPRLGWIYTGLAQLDVAEERWLSGSRYLDLAGEQRELVLAPQSFGPWLDGLRADLWNQIGMPEIGVEWSDAQWAAAVGSSDPLMTLGAFRVRAAYLEASNDYPGLHELEAFVQQAGWLDSWRPADRQRAELRFANGLVEEGQTDPAANARARARLEAVLAADVLPAADRAWALHGVILAELDAGLVAAAAAHARELRALLASSDGDDLGQARNVMAPKLVALEGLVALARAQRGEADDAELQARLADVQAAWQAFRVRWADTPTRDGGIGYLFLSHRQLLVEALIGLQARVLGPERGAEAALAWLVEAQLEGTLVRRMQLPASSFAQARAELLSPSRGLIAWVPLRGRSFALAADADRAQLFELSGVIELEERASELTAAVQAAVHAGRGATDPQLTAALLSASASFFPSALAEFTAGWSALYLVGLDDAGYVPFELFDFDARRSQGEARALSRLPSLPVGLHLLARAQDAPAQPVTARLLFADRPAPAEAEAYGVQPFGVDAERVQQLERALGSLDVQSLRGDRAVLAALGERDAGPDGLWLVVAHGIRRRAERPPGILLAAGPDRLGAVFAEQIEQLQAPRLALLWVCGAARSRLRRGDGSRSDLSASLFLGGAAAVASSPADLEVEPALRVGVRVHAALAAGAPLAEALRLAREGAREAESGRGREWLAAHMLQASGAGLTARLVETPLAAARPERRSWPGAVMLGLIGLLALGVAWRLRAVARRRAS